MIVPGVESLPETVNVVDELEDQKTKDTGRRETLQNETAIVFVYALVTEVREITLILGHIVFRYPRDTPGVLNDKGTLLGI